MKPDAPITLADTANTAAKRSAWAEMTVQKTLT
jgi:hypothetical protein